MNKADLSRLENMLARMDLEEGRLQHRHGDAAPRSVRATQKKDADAIRAALKVLRSQP